MNRLMPGVIVGLLVLLVGCHVGRRIDGPDDQAEPTYYDHTEDYREVFDATRTVLDRYATVMYADRSQGEIEAEMLPDTSLFHRTRKVIHAYVHRNRRGHDVEIRVVHQIDDSEAVDFFTGEYNHYDWRVVGSDQAMETRLLQEVKLAVTDNAYLRDRNWRLHPFPRVEEQPGEGDGEATPSGESSGPEGDDAPTVNMDDALIRSDGPREGLSEY